MAILIPTDAFLQVTAVYQNEGVLTENVWFIQNKVNNTTLDAIALSFRDNVTRNIRKKQGAACVCTNIIVRELLPAPLDPYEFAMGDAGLTAGDQLPQVMAIVLSLKTGFGGRRNRGRKYIGGVPAADEASGKLSVAAQGSWVLTVVDPILTAVGAGASSPPFILQIMHRTLGGAPVPLTNDSFVPVNSIVVQPTLGTMRSRIPGHGA